MLNKIGEKVAEGLLFILNKAPWLPYVLLLAVCVPLSLFCEAIPMIVAGCVLGIGECTIP